MVENPRQTTSPPNREPSPRNDGRLLRVVGVTAVAVSIAQSVVGYLTLPGRIRVHWSLGLGPFYGPEFAPTLLVSALFPILVGGLALGSYWAAVRLRAAGEFAGVRRYYLLAVFGGLLTVLATQAVLVVANL